MKRKLTKPVKKKPVRTTAHVARKKRTLAKAGRILATSMLAFAAVLASGCAGELPSRALVDDLRVLAIRAEPPEAAPGEKVEFEALIGDPAGNGRPLRRGWAICNPRDEGVGSCGDPVNIAVLGTTLSASWQVPPDVLDGLDEEERLVGRDVYVVLGVEPEGVSEPNQGEYDIAFKRVRISTSPTPNANPVIDDMTLEGLAASGVLPLESGSEVDAAVRARKGSAEDFIAAGETYVEDLRFTWLITGGSVADPVSWGDETGRSGNRWKGPRVDEPREETIWVVLRDGRGGTAWAEQHVRFE